MTSELGLEATSIAHGANGSNGVPVQDAPAPQSNLAQLLDSFTAAITHPEGETVGGFATTLDALYGELALLAHHFSGGAAADGAAAEIEFDRIFPATAAGSAESAETGIAAAEELEHTCQMLSRV